MFIIYLLHALTLIVMKGVVIIFCASDIFYLL